MITILTTAKPFVGQIRINQINALSSWKALSPDVEIILFGSGEGYAEVAKELGLIHVPEVQTSGQGTPLHNSMFAFGRACGRYSTQAFISCDIILLNDFLPAVQRVEMDRFLMVGQRWDIDLNREIDFKNPAWEQELREEVRRRGVLHPPSGCDYFAYRGPIWEKMPPVVVGRAGEDNTLIHHCRASRVPVIDASDAVTVVHQNHDYSHHPQGHDGVWYGAEAQLNLASGEAQLNRGASGLEFAFTLIDANWRLSPEGLSKNRCRGDWVRYLWGRQLVGDGPAWFRWPGYGVRLARRARRLARIAMTPLRGCIGRLP